jgi:hypothetical protein
MLVLMLTLIYVDWIQVRAHTREAIEVCMSEPTLDEYERCAVLIETVGDVDGDGRHTWHDAYVKDHCERCPECCIDFDDPHGPSGPDRTPEETFCTPDVCPGRCCPCVKGAEGKWWIDATYFGTDDDIGCGVPYPAE